MEKNRGSARWSVVFGIVAFVLVLVTTCAFVLSYANERAWISTGISNCRQIVMGLKLYAADHDGKYPDAFLPSPQSSNEVFRVVLRDGTLKDEMIFGSFVSPFRPDGNLGPAPDFAKALEAGENHWAMTAGLADSMAPEIPLVYENPAAATWPPKWNASALGTPRRGRSWTWSRGIILGLNDGSARIQELESRWGSSVGLTKSEDGKDLFEAALDPVKFPKGVVLDVLEKK